MKIRKSIVVAIVIVAAAAVVVVAGNALSDSGGKKADMRRGGRGDTVVSVKTQELKVETLHGYVSTNGEVESQNSVSVFPDIAGKIVETSVMLGSSVRKGEIIAYVDPSAPGSYYKKSPVYAPISGSVISTPIKNGTTVSTGTAVCVIGDINNLQVSANVPERYVSVLAVGLKADVSVEAYPGVVFSATVTRVSPVVDASSRTKQVILQFDEKDPRVNAGMFAKVVLFTEDYDGFVTMPSDSLVQNGDSYFAYVLTGKGTVSKREVSLGKTVDGIVQITSGVEAGERVVVQGQTALADGSKVQDISEKTPKKVSSGGGDKKDAARSGGTKK